MPRVRPRPSRHHNRLMQWSLELLIWFLLGSSSRLFLPNFLGFAADIIYLFLEIAVSIYHINIVTKIEQSCMLTSVKHSPGVVMRNPSSPWFELVDILDLGGTDIPHECMIERLNLDLDNTGSLVWWLSCWCLDLVSSTCFSRRKTFVQCVESEVLIGGQWRYKIAIIDTTSRLGNCLISSEYPYFIRNSLSNPEAKPYRTQGEIIQSRRSVVSVWSLILISEPSTYHTLLSIPHARASFCGGRPSHDMGLLQTIMLKTPFNFAALTGRTSVWPGWLVRRHHGNFLVGPHHQYRAVLKFI